MLKDRREGVVYLHWCALSLAAIGIYFGWVAVSHSDTPLHIYPLQESNVLLYFLGVVVASFWINSGLRRMSHRLGRMGLLEAIPFTLQQLSRFIVVLLVLAFATKDGELSRRFLLWYVASMAVVLTLANTYIPPLLTWLFFRGSLMRTVAVAGPAEITGLNQLMAGRSHLGMELVGWVGRPGDDASQSALARLGDIPDLRSILREKRVTQVVISQHSFSPEEGRAIAQCAEEAGCRVRFSLHAQRYFPDQPVIVEQEGPFMLMAPANEPLENPVNRLVKRGFDVAVALPVVLLVLPVLALLVWLMQRRQSPGPLFHRHYRAGLDGKQFLMYKFRTMHVASSPGDLTVQAKRNDSRVYPFGAFLRRTSLDEFPQFLNVFAGDMSVNGPRPHLPEHDERFAQIVNTYYTRHFVKPGITGLAQCQGYRGEITEPGLLHKRIHCDMLYIRQWTLSMDLQILAQTARQLVFPPRSAY